MSVLCCLPVMCSLMYIRDDGPSSTLPRSQSETSVFPNSIIFFILLILSLVMSMKIINRIIREKKRFSRSQFTVRKENCLLMIDCFFFARLFSGVVLAKLQSTSYCIFCYLAVMFYLVKHYLIFSGMEIFFYSNVY